MKTGATRVFRFKHRSGASPVSSAWWEGDRKEANGSAARSSAQTGRGHGAVAAAVAGVAGPGAGGAGGWLGAGVTEPDGLAGRDGPGDGVTEPDGLAGREGPGDGVVVGD